MFPTIQFGIPLLSLTVHKYLRIEIICIVIINNNKKNCLLCMDIKLASRLRLCENSLLRRTFGTEERKVAGEQRKLHSEKPNNNYLVHYLKCFVGRRNVSYRQLLISRLR